MGERTCSLPDCDRTLLAHELCSMHYQRLKHTGTTDPRPPRPPKPPCSVDGCGKKTASLGWCHMHYRRWRVNGTLDDPIPRTRNTKCAVAGCTAAEGKTTNGLCSRHAWRLKHHGDVGSADVAIRLDAAVCEIDGCDRTERLRRGWCTVHYQRWQHHGDPTYERSAFPDTCTIPGCVKQYSANGWCGMHYGRWLRTGTTADPVRARKVRTVCTVGECRAPELRRGMCVTHYDRWKRHGDPAFPVRARGSGGSSRCAVAGCMADSRTRGLCQSHYSAELHDENRDEANARMRAHYQANREYYYSKTNARRERLAIRSSLEDRQTAVEYRKAIAADPCLYCAGPSDSVDHYFPVSKGGVEVWWNLVRACEQCNKRKAARCGTWFLLRRGTVEPARSIPPFAEAS